MSNDCFGFRDLGTNKKLPHSCEECTKKFNFVCDNCPLGKEGYEDTNGNWDLEDWDD